MPPSWTRFLRRRWGAEPGGPARAACMAIALASEPAFVLTDGDPKDTAGVKFAPTVVAGDGVCKDGICRPPPSRGGRRLAWGWRLMQTVPRLGPRRFSQHASISF